MEKPTVNPKTRFLGLHKIPKTQKWEINLLKKYFLIDLVINDCFFVIKNILWFTSANWCVQTNIALNYISNQMLRVRYIMKYWLKGISSWKVWEKGQRQNFYFFLKKNMSYYSAVGHLNHFFQPICGFVVIFFFNFESTQEQFHYSYNTKLMFSYILGKGSKKKRQHIQRGQGGGRRVFFNFNFFFGLKAPWWRRRRRQRGGGKKA